MKLVWIIAYSEEKEICKNSQHSSRKKYLRKIGVALPRSSGWITILGKIFKNILDYKAYSNYKKNYAKIFIRFIVIIF